MKSLILLEAQQGGGWSMLLMLVAMFAIMYFFMIRPQQKKQKEIQKWRNALEKGQEVVTAGGIYGTIREVDEANNILVVEIAHDVRIRIDRNSVYSTATGANQK